MRTMFGTELSQISLLYFLTYVASAGEIKHLLEATPGSAQEFKIKVIIIDPDYCGIILFIHYHLSYHL